MSTLEADLSKQKSNIQNSAQVALSMNSQLWSVQFTPQKTIFFAYLGNFERGESAGHAQAP